MGFGSAHRSGCDHAGSGRDHDRRADYRRTDYGETYTADYGEAYATDYGEAYAAYTAEADSAYAADYSEAYPAAGNV